MITNFFDNVSHCSLRHSVPNTSCLHLKKPLLALFLPKISFSNLPQWLPSREYFKLILKSCCRYNNPHLSVGSRQRGCCSTEEGDY